MRMLESDFAYRMFNRFERNMFRVSIIMGLIGVAWVVFCIWAIYTVVMALSTMAGAI